MLIDKSAAGSYLDIQDYYLNKVLKGEQLNKTFHKSWAKIKNSTRFELYVQQMLHYYTTYGTQYSSDFVYVPDETLDIPKISVTLKVVKGLTKQEIINKSLKLLSSGIALKTETIDTVFDILTDLGYNFTGEENINNKEAIVKIADVYGIYPKRPEEFLRFIIYKATGNTLLIKDKETIDLIKSSNFNPNMYFNKYGLTKLASVFNRYKPLFLAFKTKAPTVINKISKLSKKHHKPLKEDVLNKVTSEVIDKKELENRLKTATFFQIARAFQALHNRLQGDVFTYNIRNGISWTNQKDVNSKAVVNNYPAFFDYFKNNYDLKGRKFYIPDHIDYAIPTSEKKFVGNIPVGTKIRSNNLIVGIYWENSWGARDLDLSSIGEHKVGWNSSYDHNGITYSGDLTDASNGAVEYLNVHNINSTNLVINNVYNGDKNSGYKIIVAKGDNIDKDYMLDPNNLIFQTKATTVQKNNIVGLLLSSKEFVVLNLGAGNINVSDKTELSKMQRKSLEQKYKNPLSLSTLIRYCGGEIVDKRESGIDLSPEVLEKDTILNIFN